MQNPRPKITIGKKTAGVANKRATPEGILGRRLVSSEITDLFHQRAEVLKTRDPRYIRAITIGQKGSGKSYAIVKTLPRPLLLFCFDPDAERLVTPEEIENGEVLPLLYYGDDPNNPHAYSQYEQDVERWKANGFFDAFASVAVDSLSTLQQVHLRQIAFEDRALKTELKRFDKNIKVRQTLMPQLQDYNVLKTSSILGFMSLCSIPCHLVLTAHIQEERYFVNPQQTAIMIRQILNATPALQSNIPPLFSEVYLSQKERGKVDAKGKRPPPEYVWLTDRTPKYSELPLTTRFNSQKTLVAEKEPQDFRALLKKVNYLWKDKPFIQRSKED